MGGSNRRVFAGPRSLTFRVPAGSMASCVNMTFWEKAATTRWGTYVTEVERRIIIEGHALAVEPARALEVGCEGGRWSKLLSGLGWMMTCIDVNAAALAACREKVPEADCILAQPSDQTLPCSSDSMALLLCMEVAPVIHSDWFLVESPACCGRAAILVGMAWNSVSLRGVGVQRKLEDREPGRQ